VSFSEEVYAQIRKGCQDSAAAVVPAVIDLVAPKTVVDVGGGEGWWGQEFRRHECQVVVLDSSVPEMDPVEVDVGMMVPGEIQYRHLDLADPRGQMIPFPPSGRYDLAVCLEVAEHLPEERAEGLVHALCDLAPVVLWSAAIPGQGGRGHINEQWPEYWAGHFWNNNMLATSAIREAFWDDYRVEPWYRQNMLFYAPPDWYEDRPEFTTPFGEKFPLVYTNHPASLVHPEIYGWRVAERDRLNAILHPDDPDGYTSR
jgi:hypothetical protein